MRVLVAIAAVVAVAAACAAPPPASTPASTPASPPASPPSSAAAELAVTSDGALRGRIEGTAGGAVRVFRGVPYAAAPVGDLRWRAPRPAPGWAGTRDATAPAPLCAQNGLELGRPSDREDCLTLDVTAPAPAQGPRAVLVWLHGGSFVDGGGGLYGAGRLAARGDLVVVTVNYRLGAPGFLAHPALGEAGALGLADQQAALRWVHREIGAFGGDPGRVTLAGESAGGAAVCAQLAAPGTVGLVHRAIVQSADCTVRGDATSSAPRPRAVAERAGLAVAAALGCPGTGAATAACLRRAPVAAVRAASNDGAGSGPSWGTPELPVDPTAALLGGRTPPVPQLISVNRDEERFRLYGEELATGRPTTLADLRRERDAPPPDLRVDPAAVAAAYPCAVDACAARTLAALRTDVRYVAGTVALARATARRAPVWVAEFADPAAPWFRDLPPARFPTGAYHTAELPFLFDVPWSEPLTTDQVALADTMIDRWSAFARDGDPRVATAPPWPRYRGGDEVLRLAPGPDGVGPASGFGADHQVGLWSPAG